MGNPIYYNELVEQGSQEKLERLTQSLINLKKAKEDVSKSKPVEIFESGTGSEVKDVNESIEDTRENIGKLNDIEKELIRTEKARNIELQKQKLETREVRKRTTELAKEQRGMIGEYEKLSKSLNTNIKKYRELVLTNKGNTKEAKALRIEIQKQDATLKNLDKTVGRSQRNVGNYGSALSGVGRNMKSLALQFIGFYAILRGLGAFVRTFMDFEKAQSRLASITGKTKDEIKDLTQQAKNLGAITAFTASQVTSLQIELAKLGFSKGGIKDSTRGILDLAAATGTDLAESATIAGSVLRAFSLDTTEMGRVVDVLAKSTSTSALDMEKLKTSLGVVAPVAANAGYSIEQTVAILGKLVDRGIDASTAGTGLRNVFLELSKQGITLEEALGKIQNASDKNAVALELFGKRGATVGSVMASTSEDVKELTKVLEDAAGTAQEMAEKQLDNLAGSITKLSSAWEGFILNIEDGEGIISRVFKSITDYVTGLLQAVVTLDEYTKAAKKAGIETEGLEGALNALSGQAISVQYINTAAEVLNKRLGDNVSSAELFVIALKKLNEKFIEQGRLMTTDDIRILKDKILELRGGTNELDKTVENLNENLGDDPEATIGIIKKLQNEINALNKQKLESLSLSEIRQINEALEATNIQLKNIKAGILSPGEAIDIISKDPEKLKEAGILNDDEKQQIIDNILQTRDDILTELEAVGDEPVSLFSILGFKDEEDMTEDEKVIKERFDWFISETKKYLSKLSQIRIDAANEEIDLRNDNISDLEEKISEQKELQTDDANRQVNLLKQQLADENKARNKAIEDRGKAQQQQQIINDAQQISAIVTAAANVIEGYSTIPIIGTVLGAAAVAAMIAGFVATKTSIADSVKAEKGYSYVMGGKRHSEGGNLLPGNVEAEKGEVHSIFSRKMTNKIGSNRLIELSNAINAGKVSSDSIDMLLTGIGHMPIMPVYNNNNEKLEGLVTEIVQYLSKEKIQYLGNGITFDPNTKTKTIRI